MKSSPACCFSAYHSFSAFLRRCAEVCSMIFFVLCERPLIPSHICLLNSSSKLNWQRKCCTGPKRAEPLSRPRVYLVLQHQASVLRRSTQFLSLISSSAQRDKLASWDLKFLRCRRSALSRYNLCRWLMRSKRCVLRDGRFFFLVIHCEDCADDKSFC